MQIKPRDKKIYEMRLQGYTLDEIAHRFSISRERAIQIYVKVKHREEGLKNENQDCLTVRLKNCLRNEGYGGLCKSEMKNLILKNPKSFLQIKNIGYASFLELCLWAGISKEDILLLKDISGNYSEQCIYFNYCLSLLDKNALKALIVGVLKKQKNKSFYLFDETF